MFWSIVDRLSPYLGIFRRLDEKRCEKVSTITDSKHLMKIYLRKESGWHLAIIRMTDPGFCYKLYYKIKNNPKLNTNYINKVHLLLHTNDSDEKQNELIELIENELRSIQDFSEKNRRSIELDKTSNQYGLSRLRSYFEELKKVVSSIENVKDKNQRIRLLEIAIDILKHLPSPFMSLGNNVGIFAREKEKYIELLQDTIKN